MNRLLSITIRVDFSKDIKEEYTYKYCIMGRQKAILYDSPTILRTRPGEFIFSDLIDSLSPIDFNSYRYFITFKDNFTYYSKVYYIYYKSKTFAIFLRFKAYLESLGYRIYYIRIDNREEYVS